MVKNGKTSESGEQTNRDLDNEDQSNTLFRLRHLNSGQHLIFEEGKGKKLHICLADLDDSNEEFYTQDYLKNTLFTLESQSVDPDERLKPSIVVKIKH